jgi:prevent-host-death family protein
MITVTTSKIRESLSDTINRVVYRGERVQIERHGKPVAAIVSLRDLEAIEQMEDQIDIKAAKEALKEPGRISLDEYKRKRSRRPTKR